MSVTERIIKTSHGDIAVNESGGDGMPVLFIHGNSSSKEVFGEILAGPIGKNFRAIAIDLPGHGASSDAVDPMRTYSMPGYADAAVETLALMGIDRAAVVGWSLGGHVAMEMMPRFPGMVGVMISGAPPVGQGVEKVMMGFRPSPHVGLVGQPELSPDEIEIFLYASYGPAAADPRWRAALMRTDGRARALMFQSLATGGTSDQRAIVENSPVPVAVVNGADDPLVETTYVGNVAYRALWDNHCYVLRGAGHASFLHVADAFDAILSRFLADMAKRNAKTGPSGKVAAA